MAKITKLKNGLKVVTETVKGVESVFAAVGVHTGNRSEKKDEIGLSHFLEHMLFKGTTTRTCKELGEAIDAVGSRTNAYTSNEQTVYHIKGLKDNLELSIEILSDQVLNSVFPEDEMYKENSVVVQEIKRSFDNPGSMLYQNFVKQAYKGNRLETPILGFEDEIMAYTPEDMKKYYTKHYQPSNMILSVVGNVKHKDVVELAKKYFDYVTTKHKKTKLAAPGWHAGEALEHVPSENQVSAMIAWPIKGYHESTIQESIIAQVTNAILSSGMSSKLFSEIREKRGLVYSVSSYVNEYSNGGYFAISGGTDYLKLNEFLDASALVMKTFNAELTDADLSKAKNMLKAGQAMGLENISSIGLSNINNLQEHNKIIPIKDILAAIDAVTIDEVKDFVTNLLSQKVVLSIYGNAPQLLDGSISAEKFETKLR